MGLFTSFLSKPVKATRNAFHNGRIVVVKAFEDLVSDSRVNGKASKYDLCPENKGYRIAYDEVIWVAKCVDYRANCVSVVPIGLFRGQHEQLRGGVYGSVMGSYSLTPVYDHPALSVMNRPNTQDTRTFSELMKQTETDVQIYGASFWVMEKDGSGTPISLHRLPPQNVTIERDTKAGGYIKEFQYKPGNGKVVRYPPSYVLYFRIPDPDDTVLYRSPLRAAIEDINLYLQARRWNHNFFKNNGVPEGFVKMPDNGQSGGDPSEDVYMIQQAFRQLYGHENDRSRSVGVLYGADWVPTQKGPHDLEFDEALKRGRDAICASQDVPVFLVVGNEASHFATAKEQKSSFWEDVLIPRLGWYGELFTSLFLPFFPDSENLFYAFDVSEVEAVQDTSLMRQERIYKATGVPIMTPNESRTRYGMKPVEGGDELFVPANMMPISAATFEAAPGPGDAPASAPAPDTIPDTPVV